MYKHAFNSSCIEMRCCALRMPYKKNIDAFLPCLQNQTKYRIFLHKITLESSNCETQTKIKRVFVVIKFIPTTYFLQNIPSISNSLWLVLYYVLTKFSIIQTFRINFSSSISNSNFQFHFYDFSSFFEKFYEDSVKNPFRMGKLTNCISIFINTIFKWVKF